MRYNFFNIIPTYHKYRVTDWIIGALLVIVCVTLGITYAVIAEDHNHLGPDPNKIMGWILIDLLIFLAISVLFAYKLFKDWFASKGSGSRLQNRMILMFILVAAIPTIAISIFSSYFFNFGVQSWFDKKIQAVLDQSVVVAEGYILEHKLHLKDTIFSVADDLRTMGYDLVHDPVLFSNILDQQGSVRDLDEVIVFKNGPNDVLARASMSFPLSFSTIHEQCFRRADRGEVVEVNTDPGKIRMLIKLYEYNNSYLVIGKLIDKDIIDHVNKTQGAAAEYNKLKKLVVHMQVEFSVIFIIITIILMTFATICGVIFSSHIVKPIRKLVIATEEVKAGNLLVKVECGPENDEIGMLSSAFNRMVKKIDHQQKDLIIAQRALAWSDVARRVAHEIKNPLTPIQLSAERIMKKFSSEVQDKDEFIKYTNTILRNSRDIGKIVTEFVNFAKMPAPKFEIIDIIGLIKSAIDSCRILHDDIKYIFHSSLQSMYLSCDNTQINQVMMNLLKNAAEALELYGNKIITVEVINDESHLIIQVTDNGKGFPLELMDKITEPYITTRSKGTGLGLAIVKKIIEDHHGTMEISNVPGGRVTLTFDLDNISKRKKFD